MATVGSGGLFDRLMLMSSFMDQLAVATVLDGHVLMRLDVLE